MDVLKILGVVAAVVIILIVYFAFDSRCEARNGRRLLTDTAVFGMAVAGWLVYIGIAWRQSLMESGGDALNGMLIAVCGAALALFFMVMNYRNLGPFFGSLRTALQLLFLPVSMVLTPFYPLWALWKRMRGPIEVYVINDR